jgi:hypothetical protein
MSGRWGLLHDERDESTGDYHYEARNENPLLSSDTY